MEPLEPRPDAKQPLPSDTVPLSSLSKVSRARSAGSAVDNRFDGLFALKKSSSR